MDDAYLGLDFDFKNFKIQVQKMKNNEFKSKGTVMEIKPFSAQTSSLKVEIPFDEVYKNKQNIVFSAMYTEKVPAYNQMYSQFSDKDRFLSGQITMEARISSSDIE